MGHGRLVDFALCFFVFVCVLLLCYLIIAPFRGPLFNELKNMRGDADQVADVRNRRVSIFLPINPLKIITTVSGSALSKCLGNRIDLIWFGSFATRFSLVAIYAEVSAWYIKFNTMELRAANSHFCGTVTQY